MRAMILAAGFGTRLLPYSNSTPKPLFTIGGRPLLDIIIRQLLDAGCRAIIINTHHLHDKIASFVAKQNYSIPITVRREPEILGTGGGIKNVSDFWTHKPFIVINSDIVTDIDLKQLYRFHLEHPHPVTLVLHDFPRYNNVAVRSDGFVNAFYNQSDLHKTTHEDMLAFTGIQILDPIVLQYIPTNTFYSSIDAYRKMIAAGKKIKGFIVQGHRWQDIGTPESYRQTAFEQMAPEAFRATRAGYRGGKIAQTLLKGDGSDRKWYRLTAGDTSLIMADHGIRQSSHQDTQEVDAFVAIGKHLKATGTPVPQIYLYDTFTGLVFMEDVGDENLQNAVNNAKDSEKGILSGYQSVIRQLVTMSVDGAVKFNRSWAWQTPEYSRDLILEKECRYFVNAFLKTFLGLKVRFNDLAEDFALLADRALEYAATGFMHRDMQSRNIMVQNGIYYFIDFQGGRLGPLQYDLASLLIDPYVNLPDKVQSRLLEYCIHHLASQQTVDPDKFRKGFQYCSLTRNLQILGAFAFLSRVKGKTYFESYIPAALRTLMRNLSGERGEEFPGLKKVVDECCRNS